MWPFAANLYEVSLDVFWHISVSSWLLVWQFSVSPFSWHDTLVSSLWWCLPIFPVERVLRLSRWLPYLSTKCARSSWATCDALLPNSSSLTLSLVRSLLHRVTLSGLVSWTFTWVDIFRLAQILPNRPHELLVLPWFYPVVPNVTTSIDSDGAAQVWFDSFYIRVSTMTAI